MTNLYSRHEINTDETKNQDIKWVEVLFDLKGDSYAISDNDFCKNITCISGSCELLMEKDGEKDTIALNSPSVTIRLEKNTKAEIKNYTPDTKVVVEYLGEKIMSKKVSVVIPLYNVKPNFIEVAIYSVLNQTYKNIELIVVNDGSTDERTIEYLKTIDNPEIKIINQDHKGVGGARNTGIESATGEYIGFLDADDWLDLKFYEVLYNLCEENNADIACGTLTRAGTDYQKLMDHFKNKVVTDFVEKMEYIKNGSVCSKLFKKNLFSSISFKEHRYYEDNPVLVELLIKSNKVAFTNTVKYYYRENPVSIIKNPKNVEKRNVDRFYMLQNLSDIIQDKEQNEKDAVWNAFTRVLVDGNAYSSDEEYKLSVNNLLGKNYKNHLEKVENSFIENIFSIKNTLVKTHKVITILWIKFKIKRIQKSKLVSLEPVER